MNPHPGILAGALALLTLLGTVIHLGLDRGEWNIRLPKIDGKTAVRPMPAIAPPPAPEISTTVTDRRPARTMERRLGSATTGVIATREPKHRSAKDPEAGAPYWCFRTFVPGKPWMMNSDENNSGNAAISDTESIWNGEHSLRLEYAPIAGGPGSLPASIRTQRNVLWQAIRAAPFRGKRIAFRPHLRATSGSTAGVFLRAWESATGGPQLAVDAVDPSGTPTEIWSGAWGNPLLLLDVPVNADVIYYGIVQMGRLPVWIDDVVLTSDPAVIVPGPSATQHRVLDAARFLVEGLPTLPIEANWIWKEPQNLDFEIVYPDEDDEPLPDTPPLPC